MALVVGINSYGSLAEADAYFADSIRSVTWSMFSNDSKNGGLIESTRILERLLYNGAKELSTQDLEFPRVGLVDCKGVALTSAQSLTYIKEIQFEYTLALLLNPAILGSSNIGGSNYKKLKAGSAEVEFFRPTIGGKYPQTIKDQLMCILVANTSSSSISGSFASGTCEESSFDSGVYDKTRGFY